MSLIIRKKSLASRFSFFTIMAIFFQSLLLVGTLIAGGVLKQSRENVYTSFSEKVLNRSKIIQSEIDNKWTNISPYVREISKKLDQKNVFSSKDEMAEFFNSSSETLIYMLRMTGATGSFIILNYDKSDSDNYPGIYFRDYDPNTNSESNSDLYQVLGSSSIAGKLKIPLDRTWSYEWIATEEDDFFSKPFESGSASKDYMKFGYWSKPFHLNPDDDLVLTFSVPLLDKNGVVHGVMGIEISVEYFKKLLPANELVLQDSLGYLLALRDENSGVMMPLITKGGYQDRILKGVEKPSFVSENKEYKIFEFVNANTKHKIFASMGDLALYNNNVPYEKETWSVIGLMEGDRLFEFVNHLQKIFILSFIGSLVLGTIAGNVFSRKITYPITALANQVKNFDFTSRVKLEKTGLSEIDELTNAIEISNSNLLDSTIKMSQIMDLVNVRIGAFEYKNGKDHVFVTSNVLDILQFHDLKKEDQLFVNSVVFLKRLDEIKKREDPEDENVYLVTEDAENWVKINMIITEENYLGVVSDVTEEMLQKRRMKRERDLDDLTKLYNKAAFCRKANHLLKEENLKTVGFVMFDLDGLKRINDTYGHEYGDIYIKETAKQLLSFFFDKALVGRRSGDEFYVLFYGYEKKEEILDQISCFYEHLASTYFRFMDGLEFQIRISSGISWYQVDAFDFDELMEHSDYAMYQVKHSIKGSLKEYELIKEG